MAKPIHHALYFRAKLKLDVHKNLDDSLKLTMCLLEHWEGEGEGFEEFQEAAAINNLIGEVYNRLDSLGGKLRKTPRVKLHQVSRLSR